MTIPKLIAAEKKRQQETLMMIPSENYTYPEVRAAVGSVLMHKYAEGQPKKRYYQGNSVVDEVELACEQAAMKAFGLDEKEWGVNVQPYSGSPANLAVYNALLSPGEKMMAMYLPDGGHLSHGWEFKGRKVTFVSKIWNVYLYKVDPETRVFDYNDIEKQAMEFKPKLLISGGTAYPREIDHQRMGEIARKVGGMYMADIAHEAGLVAGRANTSPFPFADVVTMTTHKTLRGPRGALIFGRQKYMESIDLSIFPGLQGGPHIHTIAGIALALQRAALPPFQDYAGQVVANAKYLAGKLMRLGFDVVSGGTDKHLILIDLRNKNISGWFVAWALEAANIIANRNTVPLEDASPFYPSGLRLGTPAVTVQGMKEKEMDLIASWINEVVSHLGPRDIPVSEVKRREELKTFRRQLDNDQFLLKIQEQVKKLCRKFPVPGIDDNVKS